MPNIQVKLRRGTAAEHAGFTGAEGEVTVDTTNDTLRVHDGSTAGGERLAKYSELGSAGSGTVTSVDSGTGLTGGPITTSGTLSIANDGVGTAQIAANAVTSTEIAANAVTSTEIADNAVTAAKISDTDSVFSVNDSTNVVGVGGTVSISKNDSGVVDSITISNATAAGSNNIRFSSPSNSVNVAYLQFQPSANQMGFTISNGSGGFQSMAFNSSGNLAVPGTVTANNFVSTSDQTLKQDIETLNEAEGRVAVRLKKLVRKFRFIKEVQEGGSKLHVGVNAQEVQAAFQAEGLNSDDYAVVETIGDTLGVRYNELFAFIISAL